MTERQRSPSPSSPSSPSSRSSRRVRTSAPAARLPAAAILRLLLFAAAAILGAAWAVARHRARVPAPLFVPAPAPTYDADAGELPVPEVVP